MRIIKTNIIICPECFPKLRLFKRDCDLNRHLKLKHNSKYKIRIDTNSSLVVLRRK